MVKISNFVIAGIYAEYILKNKDILNYFLPKRFFCMSLFKRGSLIYLMSSVIYIVNLNKIILLKEVGIILIFQVHMKY